VRVRDIVITGDPVLHNRAQEVSEINDYIRDLVDDMILTMEEAPGVGLAAPQIGIPLRIFVFDWEDAEGEYHGVAINPRLELGPLEERDADPESESEGCLSVPGERFPLLRATSAKLTALDLDGSEYTIEATGWLARIFQHEFDHLEGTLYVDRLSPENQKQARKTISKNGWGEPGLSWSPGQDYLEP
jgi:peptide deformylase